MFDERAARFRIGGSSHGAYEREQPAAIRDGANQVHDRVDEAPGKVAAQGSGEHCSDLLAPGFRYGHGADERERHEQTKEEFRYPVHGTEHRLADRLFDVVLFSHCRLLVCLAPDRAYGSKASVSVCADSQPRLLISGGVDRLRLLHVLQV